MANRIIKDSFWTDEWIEDLDPLEKLFFLYLLTNPLCNIAGTYEISNKRIAYETGIDKDMVNKLFERFASAKKVFRWKNWVFIQNFIQNQSKNPSLIQWIERVIRTIPIELWTDCIQAGYRVPHTLHYLTLPNLTLPDITSSSLHSEEVIVPKKNKNKKIVDKNKAVDTQGSACDLISVSGIPKKVSTELNERRANFVKFLRVTVGVDKFKDYSEWREASKMETLGKKLGQKEFTRRLKLVLEDDFKHKNCNRLSFLRKEIESFIQTKPLTSIKSKEF